MKKKGFTLVELLAVIVILAIIAVISVPVILGVIDNSKKGAFKNSFYGIIDSAELYLAKNQQQTILNQAKSENGININVLDYKSKSDYAGSFKINESGDIELINFTDTSYCASGTRKNVIVKKNCSELPNAIPLSPTITSSDNKGSGAWHTESYSLNISSSETGITLYYGTDESNMIEGNSITSGVGINSSGSETYYVKACKNDVCSSVESYVARLDSCNPTVTITGNDTSETNKATEDVVLTANINNACTSNVSYEWYKDGEKTDVTSNTYTATRAGKYYVKVIYESGKYYATTETEVFKDYTCSGDNCPKCVRANSLHTEECRQTDSTKYCSGAGYVEGNKGTTITYGTLGTSGTLTSGDAYDCDVNGDGKYSSEEERFYYVSDYYDTSTKTFNNSYAILIYYSNVSGGNSNNTIAYMYNQNNQNWKGPTTGVLQLPSKTMWSNASLYKTGRQILTKAGLTSTTGGTLPTAFDYSNYAARFITYQEVNSGCPTAKLENEVGELNNCQYLLENTQFANKDKLIGYWIENAYKDNNVSVHTIGGHVMTVSSSASNNTVLGVRPVIEINKTDMEI